jgi:hypothetical protein
MRYAALILILLAGTANSETFKCQSGTYWHDAKKVVVVATINEDGETGTIMVAGTTHNTTYKVEGFERSWRFGKAPSGGMRAYLFTLMPDGLAYYYVFTGVKAGDSVKSSQTFFCKQTK